MRFEPAPRRRRGPGLTPLIDVVFLLLVFFMLASRFGDEGHLPLVLLADTGEAAAANEPEAIVVTIDADGRARLAGTALSQGGLRAALAGDAERPVRLAPAPETALQAITDTLALCEQAGATRVALQRSAP